MKNMSKITYADKQALNENTSIADINKVKASDLNEIKTVVNQNDDTTTNNTTEINTIKTSIETINTNIGNLNNLETTDKTNVVNSINEINNRFTYSTDEKVIGKWTNGKPLYEKTITFTDFERTGSDTYKEHNIPNIDLAFIDFSKSFGLQPSGETVVGNYAYGTAYSFQISGANKNAILYSVGSSIAMSAITVTLNYTKTTD